MRLDTYEFRKSCQLIWDGGNIYYLLEVKVRSLTTHT
jgi:hypothetical protein